MNQLITSLGTEKVTAAAQSVRQAADDFKQAVAELESVLL
jgi:Sec-independent protein translocase protein TatA